MQIGPPFNTIERTILYERVIAMAHADNRVSGGALVGSYASNSQDQWSDLDITFGIKTGIDPIIALEEWTALLQLEFDVIDYFDVRSGTAIYRVFLFSNGLELDLSVVPQQDYGPRAPSFKLLFGEANDRKDFPEQPVRTLIGWGWHHVLHANSAINRSKLWQAEFWITGLRNHLITLKCNRLGLPSAHGRGADQLPESELQALEITVIQTVEVNELQSVLPIIANLLIEEVRYEDDKLAQELHLLFQKVFGENGDSLA